MRPEFAAVQFQDRAKAEGNLWLLGSRLRAELIAPLASLLSHSPDPDEVLSFLERFAASAPQDVLAEIARYPAALTYLVAIFGTSPTLAETFLLEPDLAVQFARDRNFVKVKTAGDLMQDYARFATTSPDLWLSSQLARFKRRNHLRIALKEVLRLSTLGETTLELSALADVILANALTFCGQELAKRYGEPHFRDAHGRIARSGFCIVSLGKLGGNELNYGSDIDLLFLYAHDGATSGGSEQSSVISNKEYFVRLADAVTRTITQPTPHGEVFRVDPRLRPEGEKGDPAISIRSALEYYEHRARDWELQRLIKARHSAGDARLLRDFMRGVEPYLYRSPTVFSAAGSELTSNERISEAPDQFIDVNSHAGGIRDIEFLTQYLQRVHGSDDAWVRSGGTLFALRKLHDKGKLPASDFAALTSTYEFLRRIEHFVQLESGRQTNRLPSSAEAMDGLARRAGVESSPDERPGAALTAELQVKFDSVREIFQRLINPNSTSSSDSKFMLVPPAAWPAERRASDFDSVLRFLDAQAPEISRAVREVSIPSRAQKTAARFLAAVLDSSERFRLAQLDPERLRYALEIVSASDYLAGVLIHHPESLAELGPVHKTRASRLTNSPGALAINPAGFVAAPFAWAEEGGLHFREKMALLRHDYRAGVLALAAADLAQWEDVFAVLNRWSSLASRCIASAFYAACRAVGKSGATVPLAVLGFGRLGLREFDLASHAKLAFVTDSEMPEIAFCEQVAQKTIELLCSHTREGTVFAVDPSLDPRDREGNLVAKEDALIHNLAEAAGVQEMAPYLNVSLVAGNLDLGRRVAERLSRACFDRFGGQANLEFLQEPVRNEKGMKNTSLNHEISLDGYSDIDQAVSLLRLRHRVETSSGANTVEHISALLASGRLSQEDAGTLTEAASFLRSLDHAVRMVCGQPSPGLPENISQSDAVNSLARRWHLIGSEDDLEKRLRETQEKVRAVCRRVVEA